MGRLHTLELSNFKSYKGKQIIGPFSRFTAIIGPNGSGKSNLMDAICFVLGEKANNLRVRRLTDLIHGAPIGKPVAHKCHVTMIYEDDSHQMHSFTRCVVGASSEYRVDGKIVTPQQYCHELEKINIFIKAKNFLVYQGQVEQIAMRTPKERTQLFEEISRSCEFQAEYDRLKAELMKAEEDAALNLNKRRGIALEKREAKMEKDEAERYQLMKDELVAKQQKMYLVQLYHTEKSSENAAEELKRKKAIVEELIKKKEECDEIVSNKQKEFKRLQKELHKLEQKTLEQEKEVTSQKPRYVTARQEALHVKSKLDTAVKMHAAAKKSADAHEKNVEILKEKYKEVERKKADCESNLSAESQQLQMQLSDSQMNEYYALKEEATKRCSSVEMELERLVQARITDNNALQCELRRLTQTKERTKNKEYEIEQNTKRLDVLSDTIASQAKLLEDEKNTLFDLEHQVCESKEKLEKVTLELADVSRQLQDAHGDTAESERNKKKNEAIENLKRVFPEKVYGRLVDLCQPSHRRFQIAITKVLASNMMSVVCDTDETARECIVYLKEQRLAPETFLPLSVLEVHPINEKLRELTEPRGVKLLFDVIQCNVPVARKALQFACGNTLVCETAEDARYLAYGSASDRYKAIALDGTLFQQNGVISGGGQDLKTRARKWDENTVKKLKERKAVLYSESQQLHRTRKRELEVEMKRNQLIQIENRMKFSKSERVKIETQTLHRLENELEALKGETAMVQPKIEELEKNIKTKDVEIERMEKKKDSVMNEVFSDFCARTNIKDIRQYEQREVRFHMEKQEQLKKFDNELDRLRNELEYLKSEDKRVKERLETEKVERLTKDLEVLKKKEEREKKKLETLESEYEKLRKEIVSKKGSAEEGENEINSLKKIAQQAAREVTNAEKVVITLEEAILQKQNERHSLLHSCKMSGITLPLLKGSLADVDADEPVPSTSAEEQHSQSATQEQMDREAKIKINFKSLPNNLKEVTLDDDDEVKKAAEKIAKEVAEAQATISRMHAPVHAKANERMEIVKEKEAETTEECEIARRKARKARQLFEKIKTERYRRFQEYFEPVSQKIDEVYKQLSRNESAQAFLGADNMEEPYLEGIAYNCVAPGKRFRPMDNLSGGEKTVAALALLFAIHSRHPSPFFILDEIDAALDNTNIGKVANFICERARIDMQLIVISLKEEFYNKADALVGIYPQPSNCTTSGVLTLDLTSFKQSSAEAVEVE
uniref:Structural maintenance of chromosomes protein n=1 Tax=Syphacia muris TaxID=451379 RepID=A0A0N5AH08_9BILA